MKVTTKHLPKSRVELTVEVPAERMADFFETAYQDLGSHVQLPGFRKGKAPKSLVMEHLGADRILAAALDLALPRTYHEAVLQEELIPITDPTVHVKEAALDQPFVYVVEVDVLPQVETGNYRKTKIDKKKYISKKLDPKLVEEALGRIQRVAATPKEVLREAREGDLIEISYEGKVSGVVQEGLVSKNHPLMLGEGTLLPDFEKQLLGMKAGEKKDFTLEVPKGETKQTVEFATVVHKVSELELPPIDDELAKRFGKKTGAEVRETVEKELTDDQERENKLALESAVVEAVVKQAKVELPESLIDREVSHRVEMLTEQLQRSGQSIAQFLARQKKSLEKLREEIRPAAETAVKTGLVLRAIAENEGLLGNEEENKKPESTQKVIDFLVETATK